METTERESAARMRYKKRGIFENPKNAREVYQNEISHSLNPSLGYFIFALISGAVCGMALMLDLKPLFILAAALIPFFGPLYAFPLSCVCGSFSYLFKSLWKHILGQLLFFAGSFAAIYFLKTRTPDTAVIDYFCNIDKTAILTIAVAAFMVLWTLAKNREHPGAYNSASLFFILMPLTVLAWAVFSRNNDRIISLILTFLFYQLVSALASMTALLVRKAWSIKFSAFVMCGITYFVGVILLLNHFGMIQPSLGERFTPGKNEKLHELGLVTYTPTSTYTFTPTNTATNTYTPTATNTATATPTNTLTPSKTPTNTPTLTPTNTPTRTLVPTLTPTKTRYVTPTPVYGIVSVKGDSGVLIRKTPAVGSEVLKGAYNDSVLELLGESVSADGAVWVNVLTNEGNEGWIVESAIRTATPGTAE